MYLNSNTVLQQYKKVERNSSIITDVIIFQLYARNFGAFKSISPPSANYLNIIKWSGVEGLNSIKKLIFIIMKYSVLFEEQTKFLNII
jgi:hypothetical protein